MHLHSKSSGERTEGGGVRRSFSLGRSLIQSQGLTTMKSCSILAGAIAAGIGSSAHAAFTGWTVESRGNIGGVDVYQVFANFSVPTDIVIACLQHQVLSGSMAGVVHNDAFSSLGGTWNPALTITPEQVANDSFVTITGLTGALASTNLDPGFGTGAGSIIPYGAPDGAGWFTANPNSPIVVGTSLRLMTMQVGLAPGASGYSARLAIGWKVSPSSTDPVYGGGTYTIPAPGVATLLLAAGTLGRRRRAR